MIKHLSDSHSGLKVLVVGISTVGDDLLAGHGSVGRSMKQVQLNCMADGEIAEIVTKGADKARLRFQDEVVGAIVDISAGYPHFAHLLALKCAESVIQREEVDVTRQVLDSALDAAANDAEATLRTAVDEATRAQKRETYEAVLFSAAQLGKTEFTAKELRGAYRSVTGEEIIQNALNNYFKRLVGENDEKIMTRTGHGVYRFTDPRMGSYIRILLGKRYGSNCMLKK